MSAVGATGPRTTAEAPAERRTLSRGWAAAAAAGAVALAALSFADLGLSGRGLVGALFLAALAVLCAFDLEHRLLPNRIVLPATAVVYVANVAVDPGRSLEWTLAALGAAAFLLVPQLVYPVGLGMGDVKLGLLLGAALGRYVVTALVLGFLLGALWGIALILRHGLAARKRAFAFGPFLALGGAVALFAYFQ